MRFAQAQLLALARGAIFSFVSPSRIFFHQNGEGGERLEKPEHVQYTIVLRRAPRYKTNR